MTDFLSISQCTLGKLMLSSFSGFRPIKKSALFHFRASTSERERIFFTLLNAYKMIFLGHFSAQAPQPVHFS